MQNKLDRKFTRLIELPLEVNMLYQFPFLHHHSSNADHFSERYNAKYKVI